MRRRLLRSAPLSGPWDDLGMDTNAEQGMLLTNTMLHALIHPSAWNRSSRKFRVVPALCNRSSYVES